MTDEMMEKLMEDLDHWSGKCLDVANLQDEIFQHGETYSELADLMTRTKAALQAHAPVPIDDWCFDMEKAPKNTDLDLAFGPQRKTTDRGFINMYGKASYFIRKEEREFSVQPRAWRRPPLPPTNKEVK